MKKKIVLTWIIIVMVAACFSSVYARPGDCGFEGGISSGYIEGSTTYDYSEVCLLTGVPIELHGTVIIKKTLRQGVIRSTYTYNLSSSDGDATLRRVFTYDTEVSGKDNGQTIEGTKFARTPVEIFEAGGTKYVLEDFVFSRSNIIDHKPSVDYYAGNVRGRKQFNMDGETDGKVTVDISGDFYGYTQFWGSTETGRYIYHLEHTAEGAQPDSWGGTGEINYSSSVSKRLDYQTNIPSHISFTGGFVQSQYNRSILEYRSLLPEFDHNGISTDNMLAETGTLSLESFPVQERLPVPSLNHIRGHWAENDVKRLYSLEVFKGGEQYFDPGQVMSRAEFTGCMVRAASSVPEDPDLKERSSSRSSRRGTETVVSPFLDVPVNHLFFSSVNEAYERGLISGVGSGRFAPDNTLTMAEALTVFIRALGLESMGPGQDAVTLFRDNDQIPAYARNAAYVAARIGLVRGDSRGCLKPCEKLTRARAAALINRFIDYMREDMAKDYRERVMGL